MLAPALAEETAAPMERAEQVDEPSFWRRLWPRQDETGAAGAGAQEGSAGLTRRLAITQERLRASRVGMDLTGMRFLDLVDSGQATAEQLNDFGVWLAGQAIADAAVEYFRASLQLERGDADVWNNLGMTQVNLGHPGAKASFQRAIALEPTHALAHYNLGTVLDAEGAYDEAIGEYTRALTLEPRLGDPAYNPQAVHNERLLVVRLGLYGRKAKMVSLPPGSTKK